MSYGDIKSVSKSLERLTKEAVIIRLANGIYLYPKRDKAHIAPTGAYAMNLLGLSTQVPMNYTYLTTGSERIVKLANRQVTLKRGVPKNFCYETRLIALLVQALRALKQENVNSEEMRTIRSLLSKEPDKDSLMRDVDMMPAWMKRIVKPMLKTE